MKTTIVDQEYIDRDNHGAPRIDHVSTFSIYHTECQNGSSGDLEPNKRT